jgi:hypothetical protein
MTPNRTWLIPPPPQADALQVVHIASLAAALAKLNVKIPTEDLIKVIQEEDERRGWSQACQSDR